VRRVPAAFVVIITSVFVVVIAGVGLAVWRISDHRPVALQRATCGWAITRFLNSDTQLFRAAPGALTCFVKAARACKSASIEVTEMGVDTGTVYVFIIEPGQPSCRVLEQRQYYSANFGHSAVSTLQCRRIAVTHRGVTLTCGRRVVLLPAKVDLRTAALW